MKNSHAYDVAVRCRGVGVRDGVDALQRRSAFIAHFGWLRMLLLLSNMPLFGINV